MSFVTVVCFLSFPLSCRFCEVIGLSICHCSLTAFSGPCVMWNSSVLILSLAGQPEVQALVLVSLSHLEIIFCSSRWLQKKALNLSIKLKHWLSLQIKDIRCPLVEMQTMSLYCFQYLILKGSHPRFFIFFIF